ncbi:MAG TPA: peptidylprolyl isomerase [Candidatus Polarisedimenticolia bacterium]|jgi:peptidyl-prolyl cis-trans isomerase A (cyclophilin A)|nr:peptidylprolyl isomerase [Candidatus Polarisedimenticolia bacterium]
MRTLQSLAVSVTVLAATLLAVRLAPAAPNPKLTDPAALNETAPETYRAKFTTSKGDFVIEVTRAWAPHGADRFYNLVKNGFYDDQRFFRVVYGFMVQWGIHGDPALNSVWSVARIPDDPVTQKNLRGYVTFATAGTNTRTTQVFINYADKNTSLDSQGFAPFGKVVEGMEVVNKLFSAYGEGAPSGHGPDQNRIQKEGNAYLTKSFPKLDFIKTATIEKPAP